MVVKKPQRSTSLVVSAIKKLRDVKGTTSREITNFIASEYDVSGPSLKRHVQMALRRGMSYGVIHRGKGGYYLANPKGLTISCDTLVDRGCRKRRRKRKCGRRRSRRRRRKCGKRRRSRRRGCKGKRRRRSKKRCGRRRRRRSKKRCGRRRRNGEDEMDEMATMTFSRVNPKKFAKLGRGKFQERNRNRSKTPSNRSSATRSSGRSIPLDNHNQL